MQYHRAAFLGRESAPASLLDREIAEAVIEDPSVKRLLTITGVNINVAAGLVAAIGDIRRFSSPQKLVSYVGLNSRVRQSGLGLAQHGRISKRGRSHARAMLVEAAWAAAKAPGPLRSFFLRIRARRGHQVAAVAVARKLAVLCWHLLTKDADYQWARPALVANKIRAMQLQAGQPPKKGNKRGAAYAYNNSASSLVSAIQISCSARLAFECWLFGSLLRILAVLCTSNVGRASSATLPRRPARSRARRRQPRVRGRSQAHAA
jgi:hypothetical protein